MAYFTPAELPNNKYYIFGKGGVEQMAEKLGIPVLGQIPLVQSICEAGDAGSPAALQKETLQAQLFMDAAKKLAQAIAIANAKEAAVVA